MLHQCAIIVYAFESAGWLTERTKLCIAQASDPIGTTPWLAFDRTCPFAVVPMVIE